MVTSRLPKIAAILVIGTGAAFAQATTQQPNTQSRPPAGQTAPAQAPRTTPPAAQAPRPAAPAAAAPAATQATLVNLNTATETELDKLPQIGPARAKDIIEARTKNGRFKNWEDFVARNVVPKNAEEAIKGKVRF